MKYENLFRTNWQKIVSKTKLPIDPPYVFRSKNEDDALKIVQSDLNKEFRFGHQGLSDFMQFFEEKMAWYFTKIWGQFSMNDFLKYFKEKGDAEKNITRKLLGLNAVKEWMRPIYYQRPDRAIKAFLQSPEMKVEDDIDVYEMIQVLCNSFKESNPKYKGKFMSGWKDFKPLYD